MHYLLARYTRKKDIKNFVKVSTFGKNDVLTFKIKWEFLCINKEEDLTCDRHYREN